MLLKGHSNYMDQLKIRQIARILSRKCLEFRHYRQPSEHCQHPKIFRINVTATESPYYYNFEIIHPEIYTVKGLPVYVHLNAFAAVVLKYSMNFSIRFCKWLSEVKLPRFNKRLERIENQISIRFNRELCFGV